MAGEHLNESTTATNWLGWVAIVAAICLWAGAFPAITIGLQSFSPIPLAALRFAIAAASILIVMSLSGQIWSGLKWRDFRDVALSGGLGIALYNILLNSGQTSISAGVASFLIAIQPIFAGVFSWVLTRELQKLRLWLGCVIALFGVGLIVLTGEDRNVGQGSLLVLSAAACSGVSFVLQGQVVARQGPARATALILVAGALMLAPALPAAFIEVRNAGHDALLAVFYLAFGAGILGYLAWLRAISSFGATRASIFLFLMAPIATLMDWSLTRAIPSSSALIGGGIALAGVAVSQWTALAKEPPSST
jgi:drug/metabolite transporter (DMT)-like permease